MHHPLQCFLHLLSPHFSLFLARPDQFGAGFDLIPARFCQFGASLGLLNCRFDEARPLIMSFHFCQSQKSHVKFYFHKVLPTVAHQL